MKTTYEPSHLLVCITALLALSGFAATGADYPSTVLADGPITYWRFNDTPPTATNSGSLGAAANGFYTNGATAGAEAPRPPAFTGFEANNTALQLDGVDDFVGTVIGLMNSRPVFTISGWIRRSADQPDRTGLWGQNDIVEFGYVDNDTIQAWTDNGLNVTNPFPNGQWSYLAMVSDGSPGTMSIYTNGFFAASRPQVIPADNNFRFNIGGGGVFDTTGNFFSGQIDEVAIFDKALTADQIAAHYFSSVAQGPIITRQPQGTNLLEGGTVVLSVGAVGSPTLQYQWSYFGGEITGQTNATLVISNATPGDSGNYRVTITNDFGTVESDVAEVGVSVVQPNTPPSFTLGSAVEVLPNFGPASIPNWVTNISPSTPPSNPGEAAQTVHFIVSNNNPALFSAQPAVSPSGTLTFTPAPNACGVANVTVVAQDSGGTAFGGQDTSAAQMTTITVSCPISRCPALLNETFNASNGGFTVQTPIPYDGPWIYNAASGTWDQDGQGPENQHPNTSFLISPTLNVTNSGQLRLTFAHRHSFELGHWDGGQVRISVNGGAFTVVPAAAFVQNGYNGTVVANSASLLAGQTAYVDNSPNFAVGFITSTCTLGSFNAGDTIRVQFMAAADTNTRGQFQPNWQIDNVTIDCNECPTNSALNLTVNQNGSVSFQLPAGDPNGDSLQYNVTQPPAHGTVVVQINTGAATYSPNPGYVGPDSFRFRVTDSQCQSGEATVSITVTNCLTAPTLTCSTNIVAECTGGLTPVTYIVMAIDCVSNPVPVTCTPPSGTGFRLGTSNVTCFASVPGGSNSCSFAVTVVDTTAPTVTCSTNRIVDVTVSSGAVVTYIASAFDACGLDSFNCSPPSGSIFPVGVTTVTCTAIDTVGNSNSCSFSVQVGGITLEKLVANMATNGICSVSLSDYHPTAIGIKGNSGDPAADNPDFCYVIITRNHGPGPLTNIVIIDEKLGAIGTFPGPLVASGTIIVSNLRTNWAETTTNTASVTAQETNGSPVSASASAVAIVCPINCPSNVVVECSGNLTPVNYSVGNVVCSGQPFPLVCTPPSGTGFRLGTSNVTCFVTGTTTMCSFTVTVVDTTPPIVACSTNRTVTTASCAGTVVTYTSGAADACGLSSFNCSPPSGSTFPIGLTTVVCTAVDGGANTNSCTFTVTVCPPAPPSIANVSVDRASLWPPNHKMQDVTVNYDLSGNCTNQPPICTLSVSSNESVNGTGDGDTDPDWEIVDAHHVRLRAERAARGNGRIYTITINCKDFCGNSTSNSVVVVVAHDIKAPVSGAAFKINTAVNFAGTFWDAPGNKHTAYWTFDNVSTLGSVTEPIGLKNGTVKGSSRFKAPGVYKVTLFIKDQKGVTSWVNTAGDTEAIVVIYDPNAGYTIGGGWINSPAGAYTPNPDATGKLSFGFSSQYLKGATNPKGETLVSFLAGDLEFNALNFDYLVVAGAKAQFRGFGKINGVAGYDFILTVIDGALAGDGVDKFRIKIWEKVSGTVIYDNELGRSDADDPITPVGDATSSVLIKK